MDGNEVWRFPEGSGRQGMMERYCCNDICGAPTTSKVKGLRLDEMIILLIFLLVDHEETYKMIKNVNK